SPPSSADPAPQAGQRLDRAGTRPAPPQPVREPPEAEPSRLSRPLQGVEVHEAAGLVGGELGVVLETPHDRLGVPRAELGEEVALRRGVGRGGVRDPLEGLEVEVPSEAGQERPGLAPRRADRKQRRPQSGPQRAARRGRVRRRRRPKGAAGPSRRPLLPRLPQQGEVLRRIERQTNVVVLEKNRGREKKQSSTAAPPPFSLRVCALPVFRAAGLPAGALVDAAPPGVRPAGLSPASVVPREAPSRPSFSGGGGGRGVSAAPPGLVCPSSPRPTWGHSAPSRRGVLPPLASPCIPGASPSGPSPRAPEGPVPPSSRRSSDTVSLARVLARGPLGTLL
ncbi:hypothetical protein THAOC_22994, partial [Thalassiosira oceanica]